MLLGLILLTTASQELATPRSALILSSRQDNLFSLMTQQVPLILHTLVNILDKAVEPHPPPLDATPISTDVTLQLPIEVCEQTLQCLNHIFSWAPLSSVITPIILEVIFRYAYLGCHGDTDLLDYGSVLGSLAMDCVNELLVKNCVPRDFDMYLMKFFNQSFSLLHKLTGDEEKKIEFSRLDDR